MKFQTGPDNADRGGVLLLAAGATLLALAVNACVGFPSLVRINGDNDSLLRLVEVRDLLAGQGWFDLHQYRMGPAGGFVMHWSRLVDAPIAAIILLARGLGAGAAAAETAARIIWPALMFGVSLVFMVRAARRYGGVAATVPATVLGSAAFYFMGVFRPGALDHHNVQIMLTVAGLYFLLAAPTRRGRALMAGAAIALSLAVGMETAPFVAAIGLGVSMLFAFGDASEQPIARDFGLGFAGVSGVVFFATIRPSEWGLPACDAFSVVQFAMAALCGFGLAAVTSVETACRTRTRRVVALGLLGAVAGGVLLYFFPQCLAAPYAVADPRLHELWLDRIDEAQSLFQLVRNDPASVIARYVTPLIALVLLCLQVRRAGWRRQDWLVFSALLAAVLVSVWQVRGTNFSIAFAVIPLAAWVGAWRERANAGRSTASQLRMVLAWIVSLNVCWTGVAAAASIAVEEAAHVAGHDASAEANASAHCDQAADFTSLAALPATTVLAVSNLGSSILAYTGHRALAGPYHRNIEGNSATLDALMGAPDSARAVVKARNIGMIVLCPTDAEQRLLTRKAPDGLLAALQRHDVPDWLEPVASAGSPLQLYRVR